MTMQPASQSDRAGRFANEGSNSAEQGYKDVTNTDVTKKYLKRNLKPYQHLRKQKLHKNLKKLRGWSDKKIENQAVRAVLKKHGVKRRKLNRKFNHKKYNKKQIRRARKNVMAHKSNPRWKAKSKVARHVQNVMKNRRIMKTSIWSRKGYDIKKGYRWK
jgi:hypothetical protein